MFTLTSFREPALSSASQAGLVNNLNDGLAWGLFPILFASHGLSLTQIGLLGALYPAVWGVAQLATGALSDRWGRKWLITTGMLLQAVALAMVAQQHQLRRGPSAVLLGLGTAMVYPPCWPPSVTSPTRPGGPEPSASTGCGAMAGSPSAPCWPA